MLDRHHQHLLHGSRSHPRCGQDPGANASRRLCSPANVVTNFGGFGRAPAQQEGSGLPQLRVQPSPRRPAAAGGTRAAPPSGGLPITGLLAPVDGPAALSQALRPPALRLPPPRPGSKRSSRCRRGKPRASPPHAPPALPARLRGGEASRPEPAALCRGSARRSRRGAYLGGRRSESCPGLSERRPPPSP